MCYMYILKSEDNERKGISKKKRGEIKRDYPLQLPCFSMQSKIYCNSKVNNKGERLSLAEEKCKLFWVFLLLSRKKSEEKMRSKNLEVTFCGEFEDF